ncbi:hypothetical protein F5148DRAFT_25864 [Russula earlei]|uniref:Uncharacterized protein n=1 Tax=Russula earlei TaxID=71964 RepID=A0ACC0TSG9_9AGAM|nr:hypothetical protein F5148DRAFT_25864 [Russula earlei]
MSLCTSRPHWFLSALLFSSPPPPMLLSPAFFLLLPLLAGAQIQYPVCPMSWDWSFNSLGQSPCAVAAYLQGACDNGVFSIPDLVSGDSYTGPTGAGDSSDLCKCNTVVYSLMSACDACQGGLWFSWQAWTHNCTAIDPPTTFSNDIPSGTRVPEWAFLDVTKKGSWDPVWSYQVGDNVEVAPGQTGSLSVQPTQTTTQTSVPGLSSNQTQFMSKKNGHSRAGKVGGIVGGILSGLLVIAVALALWIWRARIKRRRMTRTASSMIFANRPIMLEKVARDRYEPHDVFQEGI